MSSATVLTLVRYYFWNRSVTFASVLLGFSKEKAMRLRSLVYLGLSILVSSLMMTSNQAAIAQIGVRHVSFDGVSFTYDVSLAGGVVSKLVRENVVTDSGAWLAQPQHIEFKFTDF